MSIRANKWILELRGLKSQLKALLWVMSEHSTSDNICAMPVRNLTAIVNAHQKTVEEHLHFLVSKELITKLRVGNQHQDSRYRLNVGYVPAGFAIEDVPQDDPDRRADYQLTLDMLLYQQQEVEELIAEQRRLLTQDSTNRAPLTPVGQQEKTPSSGPGQQENAPSTPVGPQGNAPSSGPGQQGNTPSTPVGQQGNAPSSGPGQQGKTPSTPVGQQGKTPSTPVGQQEKTPSTPVGQQGKTPSTPVGQQGKTPSTPVGQQEKTPSTPVGQQEKTPSTPVGQQGKTPSTPVGQQGKTPSTPVGQQGKTPSTPVGQQEKTPSTPVGQQEKTPSTPVGQQEKTPSTPVGQQEKTPSTPVGQQEKTPSTPVGQQGKTPSSPLINNNNNINNNINLINRQDASNQTTLPGGFEQIATLPGYRPRDGDLEFIDRVVLRCREENVTVAEMVAVAVRYLEASGRVPEAGHPLRFLSKTVDVQIAQVKRGQGRRAPRESERSGRLYTAEMYPQQEDSGYRTGDQDDDGD